MEETSWISGLDLGKVNDFSALVVLKRISFVPEDQRMVRTLAGTWVPDPDQVIEKAFRRYVISYLERFPLGTTYPAVCDRVVKVFDQAPLTGSNLAVDQTGVGVPVVDMLRVAKPKLQAVLRPVTITSGMTVTPDGAGWHVPKKDLVGVLQVLLQSHRLTMAVGVPHAKILAKELETFKVKITANANEQLEAWRERDHDDLVLSVAMALWVAERGVKQFWMR